MKSKVLVFFAAILVSCGHAFAADPCTDTITDEAGILKAGFTEVSAATKSLEAKKVEVHVYVTNDLHGQKSLKALGDQLLAQCENWQRHDRVGQIAMKPNLFVLMVSTNPKRSEMFYGYYLDAQITPFAKEINSNIRTKVFASDIEGAIVQGLNDVSIVIKLATTPNVAITEDQPSGFWKTLIVVCAVVLCALIAFFGARAYAESNRKVHFQKSAKSLRHKCMVVLEGFNHLRAKVLSDINHSSLLDWQKKTLLANLEVAKKRFDWLRITYETLKCDSNNDPEVEGLPSKAYQEMSQSYSRVSEDLMSCMGAVRRTEDLLKCPDSILPDPEITPDHPDFQVKPEPGTTQI